MFVQRQMARQVFIHSGSPSASPRIGTWRVLQPNNVEMELSQGRRGLGPCLSRVRLSFAALPRLNELLLRRPRQRIGVVHVNV